MLFDEADVPLLRSWIINRLANTSDADADVLADYVLALLRHEGDAESIRKIFEAEIPDFLREDSVSFTDDVFQALKYRSYIPGAPLPPPSARHPFALPPSTTNPPAIPQSQYQPQLPYGAPPTALNFGQPGSRKRTYNDHNDNDVDIILTSRDSYVGAPYKQARRGGGFSQRGGNRFDGRHDNPYATRPQGGFGHPFSASSNSSHFGAPTTPSFQPSQNGHAMPPLDPNSILENIQRLQQLGIPIPPVPDLPKPNYSGFIPAPHRKKQRCRDDAKGYCSRGNNCRFEHATVTAPPPGPPLGIEDYDPANPAFSTIDIANQSSPQSFNPLSMPPIMPPFPDLSLGNHRESKGPRRTKGRAPFIMNGPSKDKTKTTIVIQNIPPEHLGEQPVRAYFSQFGNILEVSMQEPDRVAIIKFETWEAAHAAWSSPKVIFDNRFVKVFWYKDDADGGENGVKNGTTNGHGHATESAPEQELDMDEFLRKQEEAQKVYEEKTQKRKELERQRKELEDRQKELRARQLEEKRKLEFKLAEKSAKSSPAPSGDSQMTEGSKKSKSQTEILRAQLAALEEEATILGIDPDSAQDSVQDEFATRGRGGYRGFRARGRYARALQGGYGYRGRGGIEARHAAYAQYSLDNRPKIIALSGVDFTNPEKDEALRRHIFGVGEFEEIYSSPTATHITFKDRKTAEQFMFGISANNTIPGLDDKIEAEWATSVPRAGGQVTANGNAHAKDQAAKDKPNPEDNNAAADTEEGEVNNAHGGDQRDMDHDMDYEVGEGWA